MIEYILVFIGLSVGFIIGISGIGGAALTAPILLLLGIPPIEVVGSDMVFNTVTKSVGSIFHVRRKNVEFTILLRLLIGTIPAFLFGSILIITVKDIFGWSTLNLVILTFISIILIIVSILHIVNTNSGVHINEAVRDVRRKDRSILSVIVGFVIGFLIQLTSIGAGTLLTPYLMRILSSPRRIVGTSILFGLFASAFASLLHFGLETIRLDILFPMFLGSIPGIFLGTKFSDRLPIRELRLILAFLILVSAILILVKTFVLI